MDGGRPAGWFKVGAVAAASALAGGLVAAWWYRKTLSSLRQAEEDGQNPQFGIIGDNPRTKPEKRLDMSNHAVMRPGSPGWRVQSP